MKRVRLSVQIALSLGVLSATVLLAAKVFGMLPDQRKTAIETRIALSENLAITSSVLANRKQWDGIKLTLRELHARNPDVLSAALRRLDDRVMAEVGGHLSTWRHTADRKSTESQIYVPIMQGKTRWGSLEVAFRPVGLPGWPSWIDSSLWQLIIFAVAANSLLYWFYLSRVLCELDPSRVMPQRVRTAFDALTEGLIVLDDAGRIVLANRSFAATMGRTPEELLGIQATDLPFQTNSAGTQGPWEQVHGPSVAHSGVEMTLSKGANGTRTFFVNAAPIEDQKGNARGFLASFAEITQLEQHKHELLKTLDELRESRDKICQQNDELAYLATRDSLTGCLNRRSFFEQFERSWQQGNLGELACIMADIDKFKSINDNHGHSTGDEVLKRVAGEFLNLIDSEGLVCRYGGEEFCVVLTSCSSERAVGIAELLRQRIASLEFSQLSVTASFGISSGGLEANSCQELLDQADKSLYYSKRTGRNRVTQWDQVAADFQTDVQEKNRITTPTVPDGKQPPMPYPAVAYR